MQHRTHWNVIARVYGLGLGSIYVSTCIYKIYVYFSYMYHTAKARKEERRDCTYKTRIDLLTLTQNEHEYACDVILRCCAIYWFFFLSKSACGVWNNLKRWLFCLSFIYIDIYMELSCMYSLRIVLIYFGMGNLRVNIEMIVLVLKRNITHGAGVGGRRRYRTVTGSIFHANFCLFECILVGLVGRKITK